MKNKLASLVLSLFLTGILTDGFALEKLKSARGYWDFDGIVEIVSHENDVLNLRIVVNNLSTDDSYRSDTCFKGMASCIVDWEIWHPDAGKLIGPFQASFQDICNGRSAKSMEARIMPEKYLVLEVRFNITTPNGGHSFKRARTNWK